MARKQARSAGVTQSTERTTTTSHAPSLFLVACCYLLVVRKSSHSAAHSTLTVRTRSCSLTARQV
jgi:hypothetical protein